MIDAARPRRGQQPGSAREPAPVAPRAAFAAVISISPARFAALTNKIAAAAKPATAVRRIGNRFGVSFSADGLVMIDMVIFLSRCWSVWALHVQMHLGGTSVSGISRDGFCGRHSGCDGASRLGYCPTRNASSPRFSNLLHVILEYVAPRNDNKENDGDQAFDDDLPCPRVQLMRGPQRQCDPEQCAFMPVPPFAWTTSGLPRSPAPSIALRRHQPRGATSRAILHQ